jgi:acetyl-CoA carboxylase biotin carboxyl carrier protein
LTWRETTTRLPDTLSRVRRTAPFAPGRRAACRPEDEASVELDDITGLLRTLEGTAVTEFEWQRGEMRLRICRGVVVPVPAPAAAPQPATTPAAASAAPVAAAPAAPVAAPEAGTQVITSPIVGTFYRAADPNSPPFVNVGDRVRVGQVLCIVEAMKLMNEIEAEVAGEILKVHPENGQPVQYGDPLFTLKPEK